MDIQELKGKIDQLVDSMSTLEAKAQIEILQTIKGSLADKHQRELSSLEKRTAELKQLIQDVKSV